jgi:cytochrome c2
MYKKIFMAIVLCTFGTSITADTWTLNSEASMVAFGSVKKDSVGETHNFETINGSVDTDGSVNVEIDLKSVQTNIEIRNERIMEHVFGGMGIATLSAQVDMEEMDAILVGQTGNIDIEGTLNFLGASIDLDLEMFAVRLSEDSVMITTNTMIFVGTEELGINAGVDKLMELAKLPGITRTTPVVLRFLFNKDEKKAEAAPAASTSEIAFLGDIKKGKKVFKKCKACHSVKLDKNGVGPSLFNIMDAKAGSVSGFKYSKALLEAELTWDIPTITAFLKAPKKTIKGTKMSFSGLKKDDDIQNIIAYLADQQ